MNPKFSVGEVVILQSESCPECNGEYSILAVAGKGESFEDPHYGVPRTCRGPGIGYVLSDASLIAIKLTRASPTVSAIWAESALRKKHQPGELSYNQLLQSLKEGEPA